MKTYLSVDLDFFNSRRNSELELVRLCYDIRNRVRSKDVLLVETHEDLLDHCVDAKTELLVNIDEHSDLTENSAFEEDGCIHCGNWVNFSEAQKYVWVVPNKEVVEGPGRCDKTKYFFTKRGAHLRNVKEVEIWYGFKKIPWDTIDRVGIALSIEYTRLEVLKFFMSRCYEELRCNATLVNMDTYALEYINSLR